MHNEEYLKKLQKKYDLASTNECKLIREEFLNYIVKASTGTINPEKIQGMLILVGLMDSWITDFTKEMEKIRTQAE